MKVHDMYNPQPTIPPVRTIGKGDHVRTASIEYVIAQAGLNTVIAVCPATGSHASGVRHVKDPRSLTEEEVRGMFPFSYRDLVLVSKYDERSGS